MKIANREHAISRGEISEERKDRFEKAEQAHEKLLTAARALAEGLHVELPDFPEEKAPEMSVRMADLSLASGVCLYSC